jgi:hypothetical protein
MAPRIEEGGPDYAIGIASIAVTGDRAVAQITAGERDGPRDTRQPLVRRARRVEARRRLTRPAR